METVEDREEEIEVVFEWLKIKLLGVVVEVSRVQCSVWLLVPLDYVAVIHKRLRLERQLRGVRRVFAKAVILGGFGDRGGRGGGRGAPSGRGAPRGGGRGGARGGSKFGAKGGAKTIIVGLQIFAERKELRGHTGTT